MGGDPILRRMLVCAARGYDPSLTLPLAQAVPQDVKEALYQARQGGMRPFDVYDLFQENRGFFFSDANLPPPFVQRFQESPPSGISPVEWRKAQVIAMKSHDIPRPRTRSLWDTDIYDANAAHLLNLILEEVRKLRSEGITPIVVFDLDDTLLTTRHREVAIYLEYAMKHQIPRLAGIQMGHIIGWDFQEIMIREMGFHPVWANHYGPLIKEFWTECFFDNAYLHHDKPFAGAPEFVRDLYEAGARIIYITGRDLDMQEGTLASIKDHGFPLPDENRVVLRMKPESNKELSRQAHGDETRRKELITASDRRYKETVVPEVAAMGYIVASFENEPKNANGFYKLFHEARGDNGVDRGRAVFIGTKAAYPNIPLHPSILRIPSYLRSRW